MEFSAAGGRCVFANGDSALVSKLLGAFIGPGDELIFSVEQQVGDLAATIYVRKSEPQDVLQAEIRYVTHPRRNKRGDLFVAAELRGDGFGVSSVNLRCQQIRDYFYLGNRRRPWNRQASFYQMLQVAPGASAAELRLAFKLGAIEMRSSYPPAADFAALERAFNILAEPELRYCYDALLKDPEAAAPFPWSGFGTLLVSGACSRDGSIFFASHILSFMPDEEQNQLQVPLRNVQFYRDHAVYRDGRRKLELHFDQACLPLAWDPSWNRWRHLLGTKVSVTARFVRTGKYCRRAGSWELATWRTSLASSLQVCLPQNIAGQVLEAVRSYQRIGQFSQAIAQIRERVDSAPVERSELRRLCAEAGIPNDFDVARISWKPDYDPFYYSQLESRACGIYFLRSEYIFDLAEAVVIEIPQLGYATYFFAKPVSLAEFLSVYVRATRDDILRNRNNVGERLGFLGRLMHGSDHAVWLNALKARLGEPVFPMDVSETG